MSEQERTEQERFALPDADAPALPGEGLHLLSYVPRLALYDLAEGRLNPPPRMRAGLVIADLEHSTRFVVALSSAGPEGIDAMQALLRAWAEALIRALHAAGGEVYQFAGDSILACFAQSEGEDDAALAARVAEAARAMQRGALALRQVSVGGVTVELRCKLGAALGDVNRLILGREDLWMHPLLVGEALTAAVRAEKRGRGGEVLVHDSLARHLPAEQLGDVREDCRVLLKLEGPPPERTLPPLDLDDHSLAPLAGRLLHPFLLKRLGQHAEAFFAELRDVTCVFIRFELGAGPLEQLGPLRAFYERVQTESLRFGGMLSQTDFTDKGNVLFVVFGAPLATERQALMATRFAWALVQSLQDNPPIQGLSVGIATGPAYCGNLGGAGRTGYTTLGEVAHIAARLMALGGVGVRLDGNSARAAQRDFRLAGMGEETLKGLDRRVAVHALEGPLHGARDATQAVLVGREAELQAAQEALVQARGGRGRPLMLVGEAGIGKSTLSLHIVQEARTQGFDLAVGASFSFEGFTPYFPWRMLLAELLGDQPTLSVEERQNLLRDALAAVGTAPRLVPGLLGLSEHPDPEVAGLDARAWRQLLADEVVGLLAARAAEGPLLLFFEDVHWADQASLDLLDGVCWRLGELPVLVLLTARPSPTAERLGSLTGLRRIDLNQLPPQAALALLRAHVRFNPPRPDLEARILERGQGNPLFIESTVKGLLHDYAMAPGSQDVRIPDELSAVMLPDSVQELVLARVDRLDEDDRALLKAASVIGRVFSLSDLQPLLPARLSPEGALAAMERLQSLGLALMESLHPPTGAFKHAVIRDVVYHTLLIGARRGLHLALAQHLERQAGAETRDIAPLLAYHFLHGDDTATGLRYTLQAARNARRQAAYSDASHHYLRAEDTLGERDPTDGALAEGSGAPGSDPGAAQEERATRLHEVRVEHAEVLAASGRYGEAVELLSRSMDAATTDTRRAEVYEGLGRVYTELGESERAIEALESSLQLYGRAAPSNLLTLGLSTLVSVLAFFLGRDPGPGQVRARHRDLKQLTTLVSLIRIYYFLNIAKLVWSTFTALRLGRRVGADAELSQAYTYYGTVLSGGGLLNPARQACEHGLQLARRGGSALAEGIALSRLGTQATFANALDRAIDLHRQANGVLRRIGEVWELQTGLMLWATSHFLRGEVSRALPLFDEMGDLSLELNARRHHAWRLSWAPYCRFLLGQTPGERVLVELEEAHTISASLYDLANQCAALNHQANVAVRMADPERAAQAALRAFRCVWGYHVLVPFLQIGLVDSAEAALYALEQGARSVPAWRLRWIVRLGVLKARALGVIYPALDGPARRMGACWVAWRLGPKAAAPRFERALERLAQGPNRLDYGIALLDAARWLGHAEYARQAREVLSGLGVQAELARLETVERSLGVYPAEREVEVA